MSCVYVCKTWVQENSNCWNFKLLAKFFKLDLTIWLKMVSTTSGVVNHDASTDNEDLIENVWINILV